jgi:hypothetical protein
MKSSVKVQLYHAIPSKIFGSLVDLQGKEGGLPYQFFYRGKVYNALLLFPLLAVLGDTKSHDQLCGRYNSRGSGVACLCRHCNIPRSQTNNVDYEWEHIIPELVQSVIGANDKEGLKDLSQHPIRNAFYKGICLGGNKRVIHGMSPGEPLHVLELGLFKMMIKGFYVNLGYKPGSQDTSTFGRVGSKDRQCTWSPKRQKNAMYTFSRWCYWWNQAGRSRNERCHLGSCHPM